MSIPTLNIQSAAKVYHRAMHAKVPVGLLSHPGIGKTDIHTQVSMANGYQEDSIFVLPTSEYMCLDLGGLYYANKETGQTERLPADIIPFDRPVSILIDEFADCPKHEQSQWYRLAHCHMLGRQRLHPGSYVAIASNRPEDRACASDISTAMKGRLQLVTIHADYNCTLDYAAKKSWPPMLIGFLRAFGHDVIDNGFNPDCPYAGSTPRDFARLAQLEKAGVISPVFEESLAQFVGNIGPDAGQQYAAFRGLDIPDPKTVIDSPESAPILSDIGCQFAFQAAIVGAMGGKDCRNVLKYAMRLDDCFGLGLILDARIQHSKDLAKCSEFVDCLSRWTQLV